MTLDEADALVSRCRECGSWVWADDPCGVRLDLAIKGLQAEARAEDAVWRLDSAAGTLAAYIDAYVGDGGGEELLGKVGAEFLADYRKALAVYEAAARR